MELLCDFLLTLRHGTPTELANRTGYASARNTYTAATPPRACETT